jgi:predicted O-methyltransferase YrrM
MQTTKDKFYVMRPPKQREGLQDMIDWINTIRPTSEMRIIEIGSYVGESTMIFAEHFKEVISVDPYINDYDLSDSVCIYAPFDKVYQQFLRNTLPIHNIKSIRDTSENALSLLKEEQWDLVYIDGIHTLEGVWFDIQNYKTIIKPGGFICGHDYSWNTVRRSIGRLLDDKVDSTFKDGSWIKQI